MGIATKFDGARARWRSRSCLGASVLLLVAALGAATSGCGAGHEVGDPGDTREVAAPAGPITLSGPVDGALQAHLVRQPFVAMPATAYELDPRAGAVVARRSLIVAFEEGVRIGAANALLEGITGRVVGVAPEVPLMQIVLAEDTTPEMAADVTERLRASSLVAGVVQDLLLAPTALPPSADAPAARWSWNPTDLLDGSWGLMFSNVPQAWNLNRAIAAKNQAPVVVAVIDTDSFASSADIPFASGSDLRPSQALLHGTMVSSVLGSSHNKQGIDGVTPFASIRARGYDTWPDILGAGVARSLFGGHAASLALTLGWLLANPARVVNMSIGFELAACNPQTLPPPVGVIRPPCDPVAAARTIDQSGDVFAAVARILDKGDRGSLFVVAAGNDSEPFRQSTRDAPNTPPEERVRGYSARWASPWCNAAVRNKAPNILAVEAISRWGANSYSNIDSGGMLAPGDEVGVSIDGITVGLGSGTSVAAPLVAGAAAFLLAVEPMLKTSQLKTLLKDAPYAAPASSINWSTTNTRLDLLASVIGIDDVLNRPERPVQRMLCDIDDGTADGFARFTHVAGEDGGTLAVVTEDKTAGDGHVDMKDFRRFRDEWLRVHLTDLVPELVQLDDPLDTPVVLSTGKGEVESFYPPGGILRDANRSGTGKAGELEMFPRSEWTSVRYSTFNAATAAFLPSRGTGSWTNRHHRGNALSGLDAALVPFKEVFEEGAAGGEGWKKSDLPALLRWSGDVHIIVSDIAKCGGGMTIDLTGERAWYERDADAPPAVASLAPLAGRRITRSNTELVVTTPLRSKVKLTWTADNAESGVHEITRDVPLGGDGYVVLQCQEPAKCAAEQACTSVVPRCLTENHQVFNKVRSDSTGVFAPAAGFACPQVDPCDFYCSS